MEPIKKIDKQLSLPFEEEEYPMAASKPYLKLCAETSTTEIVNPEFVSGSVELYNKELEVKMKTPSFVVESPINYVGGKTKLIPQLREYFPKYVKDWYEPFAGGMATALNFRAECYHLNDISSPLIRIHNLLREYRGNIKALVYDISVLADSFGLSVPFLGKFVPKRFEVVHKNRSRQDFNREAYLRLRKEFNDGGGTDMKMLLLLVIYSFNSQIRFNKKGEFNEPVGKGEFTDDTVKKIVCQAMRMAMMDISFSSYDFPVFFNNAEFDKDSFVYVDPPYLMTFAEYNNGWNDKTELMLYEYLDWLSGIGVRFAMSNAISHGERHHDMLEKWAEKYNVAHLAANYKSFRNGNKSNTDEVLIMNY